MRLAHVELDSRVHVGEGGEGLRLLDDLAVDGEGTAENGCIQLGHLGEEEVSFLRVEKREKLRTLM